MRTTQTASNSSFAPAQLGIGGAIDLTHAAGADEGGHVVVPQPRTDLEGHLSVYRVVRRSDPAIPRRARRRLHRLHRMALTTV